MSQHPLLHPFCRCRVKIRSSIINDETLSELTTFFWQVAFDGCFNSIPEESSKGALPPPSRSYEWMPILFEAANESKKAFARQLVRTLNCCTSWLYILYALEIILFTWASIFTDLLLIRFFLDAIRTYMTMIQRALHFP